MVLEFCSGSAREGGQINVRGKGGVVSPPILSLGGNRSIGYAIDGIFFVSAGYSSAPQYLCMYTCTRGYLLLKPL